MTSKSAKRWATPEGEMGEYLIKATNDRLDAYRRVSGDVEEHANEEQDAAYGGYASRQVVELIQNAADQLSADAGSRIELRLTEQYLYCADDGEPFSKPGVEALLFARRSPKRGNTQIGQFGLGFKSVLRVTSRPEVISRSGSFRFDKQWAAEQIRAAIGDAKATPTLRLAQPIDSVSLAESDETLTKLMRWATNIIRLPLEVDAKDWLRPQLEQFRPEFLLFVDQVTRLDLIDDTKTKERRIRVKTDDGTTVLSVNRSRSRWRVFRSEHEPSDDAMAARRASDPEGGVTIQWAAPLSRRNVPHEFWAYFPTQDTSLMGGILNAPWQTTEDRLNLLDTAYNRDLIDATAELVADHLPELSTPERPADHLDLLPRQAEREDGDLADRLRRRLYATLQDREIVPDQVGHLRKLADLKIAPAMRTNLQSATSAVLDMWAQYEHHPTDWLHHQALSQNRPAVLGRIAHATAAGAPMLQRASVRSWLISLLNSAIRARDPVKGSAVAIQICARLKDENVLSSPAEAGPIILTAASRFVEVDPSKIFFASGNALDRDVKIVHDLLEADPATYRTLQALGIQRPSADSAFANVVEGILKGAQTKFDRLWQLSREISFEVACAEIRRHPSWRQNLFVKTMGEEPRNWVRFNAVLLPGRVVPSDGNRDALVAINVDYHQTDLPILRELGAVDAPHAAHDYGSTEDAWPQVLCDYREKCAEEFRRRSTSWTTPQARLLWFTDAQCSGSLAAFPRLSPQGRIRFTRALLDLESTFNLWTMSHLTNTDYGEREFPSLAVELLRKHGLVETSKGPQPLRHGLHPREWYDDEEPGEIDLIGLEIHRFLLRHRNTRLIRKAFPELPGMRREEEPEPIGESDPAVVVDAWPNIENHPAIADLEEFDEWMEIVRCDGFVAADGTEIPMDCLLHGGKLFISRTLSEEEQLRCLLQELNISDYDYDIDETIRDVLSGADEFEVEEAKERIRDCDSDPARLLQAVGESNLISLLPSPLVEILATQEEPFKGERIAEAVIALFQTETLRRAKSFLGELNPPAEWRGGERTVNFVTDLGFAPEWAGRPLPKRPAFEDVRGPYMLPKLHEYQQRAVANIREVLRAPRAGGKNRGLLSLPTGAGKTRVTVEAIIDAIRDSELDGTVLWIADRDELCEQAVESWQFAWGAIGPEGAALRISRLWQGQPHPIARAGAHVVVASRQTLAIRGVRGEGAHSPLNDVGLVVIDEAHGAIAPTYTDILQELGLTYRKRDDEICLLGLTATPYRGVDVTDTNRLAARFSDNRLDRGIFASDDAGDAIRELQGMGILAEADHQIIPGGNVELTSDEKRQMEEHGISWLPGSAQRRLGDDRKRTLGIVEAYKRYVHDQDSEWPTLIFATSVAHAETVAALLQLDGIPSRAVSSKTETATRRSAVEQFRSGEIKVLVNYGVFREGFDAPKTRAIIVARPVYSPNLYFQMIGRGLRGVLNGGSERCLVLDVKDNVVNYDRQLAFTELDWLWAG